MIIFNIYNFDFLPSKSSQYSIKYVLDIFFKSWITIPYTVCTHYTKPKALKYKYTVITKYKWKATELNNDNCNISQIFNRNSITLSLFNYGIKDAYRILSVCLRSLLTTGVLDRAYRNWERINGIRSDVGCNFRCNGRCCILWCSSFIHPPPTRMATSGGGGGWKENIYC